MQKEWFLIVNPKAGKGKLQKKWTRIKRLLEKADVSFSFSFTERKGHAIELVGDAIREGYRKIVAVGGDGTANEVVNGIFLQKNIPTTSITFALLPMGSGNDWIKSHNIPNNIRKAIEILKHENTILHDVGVVSFSKNNQLEDRYFINIAGMAYDAFVVRLTDNSKLFFKNNLTYLINGLISLSNYHPQEATLTIDGKERHDVYYWINAGVCKYNGGGALFVPHAKPNDGQLAITLIKAMPKWEVIRSVPFFYNGKIANHPKVEVLHAKCLKVTSGNNGEIPIEVDGEFLGESPFEIKILERALRTVIS